MKLFLYEFQSGPVMYCVIVYGWLLCKHTMCGRRLKYSPANDLLSPHYCHLSISMLTLRQRGTGLDGISNVAESRSVAI